MNDMKTGANGNRASDNIGRGMLLSVVAILVFGVQDAISKTLVQNYSPFQVVMMRYWALAVFSLFLASRHGPLRAALKSASPFKPISTCSVESFSKT